MADEATQTQTAETTETTQPVNPMAAFQSFEAVDGEVKTPATKADTPPAETAEDETESESSEGQETGQDSEASDGEASEQPPPKKKLTAAERQKQIQANISAATRELRELQRHISEARAATQTQDLTKPQRSDTSATSDAAPRPDDKDADGSDKYPYGELDQRFIDDKVTWKVEQTLKAKEAESEKKSQAAAAEKRHAELAEKGKAFQDAGAKEFDDFEEVVLDGFRNGTFKVSEVVAELILESDVGPKVAYHLASHPKEAREIVGLSPSKQAAAFGRLEAKFSSSDAAAAQSVRATKAPPPPQNGTRGTGSKTGTPSTGSFAEFEAAVKGRAAK